MNEKIQRIADSISEEIITEAKAINPKKQWYNTNLNGPKWQYISEDLKNCLKRMKQARQRHIKNNKPQILIIQGSDRNKNTCPQEDPKSLVLSKKAVNIAKRMGADAKLLDLSRVTSEKNKRIWPCKGCYSTSPALCHVGCSCFPDTSLNQTPDWMNEEIYELLVECHGLMIIAPVYWYSRPPILSAMLSRMVCLDSANPDPTTTLTEDNNSIKDYEKSKELERGPQKGGESIWNYHLNKVLAGRRFALLIHGDSDGVDQVSNSISDTLKWMGMVEASPWSDQSRHIGYMEPYSDSHDFIDKDVISSINSAITGLIDSVKKWRKDGMPQPQFPNLSDMK